MKHNERPWKFYYWGPLLYHCIVNPEDVKKLRKISNKKQYYNHNLAGDIKEQHGIVEQERLEFMRIIEPYLEGFVSAFKHFYSLQTDKKFHIDVDDLWVNFMRAGDSNPLHVHKNCQWSSVLYLDVPKSLIKEQESFKGTGVGPGGICFLIGPEQPNFVTFNQHRPRTGEFFIFPKTVYHYVAPFKAKGTRVSMAANFSIKNITIN